MAQRATATATGGSSAAAPNRSGASCSPTATDARLHGRCRGPGTGDVPAAWRSFDSFEGRSSLRTWRTGSPQRLPDGIGGAAGAHCLPVWAARTRMSAGRQGDRVRRPVAAAHSRRAGAAGTRRAAAIAVSRESLRAGSHRQLPVSATRRGCAAGRDVLAFRPPRGRDTPATTTIAVKSALQRARDRSRISRLRQRRRALRARGTGAAGSVHPAFENLRTRRR